MIQIKQKGNVFTWLLICAVALLQVVIPATSSASSQYFYSLNNQTKTGMIVSLTADQQVIEPANNQNAKSIIGVIAPSDEISLIQQPGQISIRTAGIANTLVSTLGGNILVGDRIAPSVLTGLGAKLNSSGWMVGIAQASFDSSTSGALKTTITDTQGHKQTVYVGSIPVLVKAMYYTNPSSQSSLKIPSFIQSSADTLAGKHASVLALILSFLLIIIGLFLAGFVINGAIRGSMQAIARQPLTSYLIQRQLFKSLFMALIIIAFVLIGAFLLLRLI